MVARRPVFSAESMKLVGKGGNSWYHLANGIPARSRPGQLLSFSRKRHPRQAPSGTILASFSQMTSPTSTARDNSCPSPANDIPAKSRAGQFLLPSHKWHPRQTLRGAILALFPQTTSPTGSARGNSCPSPANDIPDRLCAGQFLPFSRKRHPRQALRGAILALFPQTTSPTGSARGNSCPFPANDIPAKSRAGQFLLPSHK